MAYMIIDTFLDKNAADEKAEAYKKAGRENVKVAEMNGITVNDCTGGVPCVAKFVQDGKPLYIVSAEG